MLIIIIKTIELNYHQNINVLVNIHVHVNVNVNVKVIVTVNVNTECPTKPLVSQNWTAINKIFLDHMIAHSTYSPVVLIYWTSLVIQLRNTSSKE
jgi:hypothetical protein